MSGVGLLLQRRVVTAVRCEIALHLGLLGVDVTYLAHMSLSMSRVHILSVSRVGHVHILGVSRVLHVRTGRWVVRDRIDAGTRKWGHLTSVGLASRVK